MLIAIMLICALLLVTRLIRKTSAGVGKGSENPVDELRGARLLMNEVDIRTDRPVPMHGRVDQVFMLQNGKVLVMDTKVRDRLVVFPSDVVQLSTYAMILSMNNYIVCPYAVIRFVLPGNTVVYRRVGLLPMSTIVSLHQRYESIEKGESLAHCSCGKHRELKRPKKLRFSL